LLRHPPAAAALGGPGRRQKVPAPLMNAVRLLPAILALALLAPARAEEQSPRPPTQTQRDQQPDRQSGGVLRLLPGDALSEHAIALPTGKLEYKATAGTLALIDQTGERKAEVFYTAYVAGGADPQRPVTFVFNGGPGAASAFLHLGLVGPRLVDFGPQGRDGAAARLRDNPETWLAFTDLVLID